jgi:predicted AAA+ superfamily ATPase
MDIRFLPHNSHHEDPESFVGNDPHLKQLSKQPLVHHSTLLNKLPIDTPGIYSISGGRQVGKTTLLKQWMNELLSKRVDPQAIIYLTGELIDDHHSLVRIISDLLVSIPQSGVGFILLDEVTYIKDWDKGVKYCADAGMLQNAVLIITGSDTAIIKEARMRFPGRRGISGTVDFHLHPLGFLESVKLHNRISLEEINLLRSSDHEKPGALVERLFEEFESYLIHGGFLTAINDLARQHCILPATFATYSDWIRGDVLKRNRNEHFLNEILGAIVKHYGSQITWNALSRSLSIDHPKTVADYISLLESMDVVFVQAALAEDKMTAAVKKARKVMFKDPFIFHAVRAWLNPSEDPFTKQVTPLFSDSDWLARLAEACTVTHFSKRFPTYYIKGKGEVEIAYVDKKRFWPVEVKWTTQVRPHELKQIKKYPNGRILTRLKFPGEIHNIPTTPLPIELLREDLDDND